MERENVKATAGWWQAHPGALDALEVHEGALIRIRYGIVGGSIHSFDVLGALEDNGLEKVRQICGRAFVLAQRLEASGGPTPANLDHRADQLNHIIELILEYGQNHREYFSAAKAILGIEAANQLGLLGEAWSPHKTKE